MKSEKIYYKSGPLFISLFLLVSVPNSIRTTIIKKFCAESGPPLDLFFVVQYMSDGERQETISTIHQILSYVAISKEATRVSVIRYFKHEATMELELGVLESRDEIIFRLEQGLPRINDHRVESTQILEALSLARNATLGDRARSGDVPKIICLIPNGRIFNYLFREAERIEKEKSIETIKSLRKDVPNLKIFCDVQWACQDLVRREDSIFSWDSLDKDIPRLFGNFSASSICPVPRFDRQLNIHGAADVLKAQQNMNSSIVPALRLASEQFRRSKGVRGPQVPKVLYIATTGHLMDKNEDIRKAVENLEHQVSGLAVWVLALGPNPDIEKLKKITGDYEKITFEMPGIDDSRVIRRLYEGPFPYYYGQRPYCFTQSWLTPDRISFTPSKSLFQN